ncbi:MAG: serine/threonine protein kinase [Alphaproteobacteria bacterium]|nr:serine/threonine protein kinase [Alphaproteobacteria bacterium]
MAQPPIPTQIGRYIVESTIGRGAMGVIYRAHDPLIDRAVALKLVRADLLEGDERNDYIERFQREAQAAARCAHANIVAIYDYALHENNPFLTMEYVNGKSLAQVVERGRGLSIDLAVRIAHQMLDALACAHGHGVVHRDIKPGNVLIGGDGRVKVTDFGISRVGGSSLTQTGALIGTPNYMSPEQCRGESVDTRSDLFSTGAVFYELLTGELPFPGQNFHEIAYQLLYGAPVPLAQRLQSVPPSLAAFMDTALARDPARRFETAAKMSIALVEATRGIGPEQAFEAPTAILQMTTESTAPYVAEIERRLAHYVGPIASYLVRSASGRTTSLEELCHSLGSSIDKPDSRAAFLREVLAPLRTGNAARFATSAGSIATAAPATAAIAQADVDLAQADLAHYIGPIARLLVRRELEAAKNADDLWQRLATHIERPADREAFLRGRRPR